MSNSCGGLADYWDAIRTLPRAAGRVRVGLGRSGARAGAPRRHGAARLRRRLRRRAQRRAVLPQRPRRRRPHAAPVAARARQGDPARADPSDRRGARRDPRSRTSTTSSTSSWLAAVVDGRTSTGRRSATARSSRSTSRRARRRRVQIPIPALGLDAGPARPPHAVVPHPRRSPVGAGRPRGRVGAVRASRRSRARRVRPAPAGDADAVDSTRSSRRSRCGARRSTTRRSAPATPTRWDRLGLRDARAASTRAPTPRRSTTADGAIVVTHTVDGPRRARRHPARRRAPPARSGRPHRRVARVTGRTSATPTAGRRAVRPVDHAGRRLARPLRAPAGERQPHRRALAALPRRSGRTRPDDRRARRPATSPSPRSPTKSWPRPTTSKTFPCATSATCGSTRATAASVRVRAAPTPIPHTASGPAVTAGRTGCVEAERGFDRR